MRNQTQEAMALMNQAAQAAPTAPAVLEALGDAFVERKVWKEARDAYQKALSVDPKNARLEKKYAEVVFVIWFSSSSKL